MASKRTSLGTNLPDTKWEAIREKAKLIGYNRNQFVEECIDAIFEMINNPGKRKVPRVVHMLDAVKKSIHIPIHLEDNVSQQNEEVKSIEKNFVSKSDEGTAIA